MASMTSDYDKSDYSDMYAQQLIKLRNCIDDNAVEEFWYKMVDKLNEEISIAKVNIKMQNEQIAGREGAIKDIDECLDSVSMRVAKQIKDRLDEGKFVADDFELIIQNNGVDEKWTRPQLLETYDYLIKKRHLFSLKIKFAKVLKENDFITTKLILAIKNKSRQKAQLLLNDLQNNSCELLDITNEIIPINDSTFTNKSPLEADEDEECRGEASLLMMSKSTKTKYNKLSFALQVLINEGYRF